MELLEERTLLATFVVTTADVDGGNGSLRDAIQDANSNPGLDLIHFNIPSATVTTDANGHVDFSAVLPVAVANRRLVSATATDPGNNTSQFSRRLAVGDVLGGAYTVNTTDDVDDGVADATHTSLREAIHAANNHPGPDTIRFAIGTGTRTISPLTPLPVLVDARTTIDGATQPGYAGSQLTGELLEREEDRRPSATRFVMTGLVVRTDDTTIRGLVMNRFFGLLTSEDVVVRAGGIALDVEGNGNVVEGNYVGTTVAGSGLTSTGTGSLTVANRNVLFPVTIHGSNNRIGGTTAQQRNVISGHYGMGLKVSGSANVIQGNYIGTNAARGRVGAPLHLSVSPTDPSPVDTDAGFTFHWNVYLDDEPVAEGDEREFSFTPGDAGTYTIDLRLGDKDFGESFATTELIVDEAGPVAAAPVVTAGEDATVDEGGTYASGGSFADSDPGDAWTATVDYGDGTGEQPLTPHADRSLDLTHVYGDDGTYDVVVRVTDATGLTGTDTARVIVRNVAPAVTLDTPAPVLAGAGWTLASSIVDPGADTWSAVVNYGDGTGNSPLILRTDGTFTLSHTYQAAGEYPVTVSVSDDDSGAGVASRTAVVEKLHASLSAAAAQATYGGTTTLSATLAVGDVPLAGKTVTFTLRGAAVGSAVTSSTGEAVLADVSLVGLDAGVAPLTASFVGDERHAAATGNATVQIAKAHLVVVVDDNSRVYGHDNPVLTGSVFGATNGDVLAVTYSTQALPISRLGTYAISAGINDPRATVEL